MHGARQTLVALATALALASSSFGGVHAQAPAATAVVVPPDIRARTPAEDDRFNAISAAWSQAFVRGQTVSPDLLREALAIETASKGPNHPDTARALSQLATAINHNLQNPAEAAPIYARAVAILEARLGMSEPDTFYITSMWAGALEMSNQPAEAEAAWRRALARAEAIEGRNGAMAFDPLSSLVTMLDRAGRRAESETLAARALSIAERHPNQRLYAVSMLSSLATTAASQNRYADAEALLRRQLALQSQLTGPQSAEVAVIYNYLGSNLGAQKRLEDASSAYRSAQAIYEAIRPADHADIAIGLDAIGANLIVQGKAREAEPLLRRALDIRLAKLGERNADTISTQQNLVNALRDLGKPEAEALARRSLAAGEALWGADTMEAKTGVTVLANALDRQGRYGEAEALLRRSLAISERVRGRDSTDVAIDLMNLGANVNNQGRRSDAEALIRRAWSIRETQLGPEHADTGAALFSLGFTLLGTGRASESVPLLRRAVAIAQQRLGPGAEQTSGAKMALGLALLFERKFDEADRYFNQAVSETEAKLGPDHPALATMLMGVGLRNFTMQRYPEAEAALARGLRVSNAAFGPQHPDAAVLKQLYGQVLLKQNRAGEAEPLLREAMTIKTAASGTAEADSIAGPLAEAYLALGRPADALPLALRSLRYVRATGGARTDGDSLNAGSRDTAGFSAVRAAWLVARQRPAEAAPLRATAFEAAQSILVSSASSALAEGAARLAAERAGAGALVSAWRSAQLRVAALDTRVQELAAAGPAADADRRAALGERDRAALESERTEAELSSRFPRYFDLLRSPPVTVAELQASNGAAQLLRPDEALILLVPGFFVPGPNLGVVMVVTRETTAWAELPYGRDELRDRTQALHAALASPVTTTAPGVTPATENIRYDRAAAHELYKALFADPAIAPVLAGKERWLIAPQGVLMSLPFAALVSTPPAGGAAGDSDPVQLRNTSWLGLTKTVTVLPSVSALRVQRLYARETTGGARTPFFGLGDPAFRGVADPDEARGARRTAAAAPADAKTYFRGANADLSRIATLPRLVGTAREIRGLAQSFGVGPDAYVLQLQASEVELRRRNASGALGRADIVAFATHGLIAGDIGIAEPALALTPPTLAAGQAPSPDNDGLLTASEAATLTLSARYLILSACNTAAGGSANAEALSGLARAFFYAGAQSLLVSHYPVMDEAGMRLTTEAARLGQLAGLRSPEAMRQSMQALMLDTRNDADGYSFAHPTMWAPYIVVDPS